ncbi:u11/u12 small nuclear ribonucleoprotein 35 kda protein [Anaeramoeba ignava]|uniref:U11/u12 small nuclear ribonucleoprotein 35 kDa protein n=1 Tax=Anaeramoeba ignava TaxID=1746090 RepID=A0A9Q0LBC6_ANAIG|nr:u11/u12 small nuclear ribonucleoprotein 35 kda protein [Anaeramoeba ignava]
MEEYNVIKAGTIDGSGREIHDRAIKRALISNYQPKKDSKIKTDPEKTIFIGRLNLETTEETLKNVFEKFGEIQYVRLIRDIVTGFSKRYAFIEFKHRSDFKRVLNTRNKMKIDGNEILVDSQRGNFQENWIPRRFGGGLGGEKKSGQMRFGGKLTPFRKIRNQKRKIDIPIQNEEISRRRKSNQKETEKEKDNKNKYSNYDYQKKHQHQHQHQSHQHQHQSHQHHKHHKYHQHYEHQSHQHYEHQSHQHHKYHQHYEHYKYHQHYEHYKSEKENKNKKGNN